jgi:RHS repeat-associated protein
MELDNEVKGNGNSYTTEFRQYDPRVGRWLSLDPLMNQFPWMSPYLAFDNNPVYYTDPLGLAAEGGAEGGEENESGNECDDGNFTLDQRSSGKSPAGDEGRFWTPEGGIKTEINGKSVNSAIEEDPDWLLDRATVVGSFAHARFDQYIREMYPTTWVANQKLDNNKRPDLLYIGSIDERGSVWELKPNPDKSPYRTAKQILGYVNQANDQEAYDKSSWIAGNSNGTPVPFSGGLTLISNDGKYTFNYSIPNPSTGMIYYNYKLNDKPKPEPVADPLPASKPVFKPKPDLIYKPIIKPEPVGGPALPWYFIPVIIILSPVGL